MLIKDLLFELNSKNFREAQRGPEYLEWVGPGIAAMVDEFIQEYKLADSYFIKKMKAIFKTDRFEALLKRWLIAYLWSFLSMLDDFAVHDRGELILDDLPLNRFAVKKYYFRFGANVNIKWRKPPSLGREILGIILKCLGIIYGSICSGLKIPGGRKKYKVMREAVWGLYGVGGYYFHDDFFVDGTKIKNEDLLLFSRGVPREAGRLKGYQDAKDSPYGHFNLSSLSLSIDSLFGRIIPKYVVGGGSALCKEAGSPHFLLYWGVYLCFIHNAVPYEKVFSHFEIASELGHNYFSASHVVESIVCQNHGVKYYLMHWSDHSMLINKFILSFLGCDRLLSWGRVHTNGARLDKVCAVNTGYVFKRFIGQVKADKAKVLSDLGINRRGKVISFFDEKFGERCKMIEGHYVSFWGTALKLAENEKDHTIIIKPKAPMYERLSTPSKTKFNAIRGELEKLQNVHIIDEHKWSFIEVIGVSDIVVTQGMTSSATIAIICGIEGLYLDMAEYDHPFARRFKNKIVFSDPAKLISMIGKIIKGSEHPLREIPDDILREFDAYVDDRGIDLFRSILSGEVQKKRVGIIVQARMGSTRLPGKVMKTILGRPMLEILIERLKRCRKSDVLIIATTQKQSDDIIAETANKTGVACFRGDEEDVLKRYYEAAKIHNLDVIVRVTSDCPLSDPALIDALITYYFSNPSADYVANIIERTYPRGFDIEVFNFGSLEKAAKEARVQYQREHVTPFISENMKGLNYADKRDASRYRVTVDTDEDLELITHIFELLDGKKEFGYEDVITLLDSRPDLVAINKDIRQKELVK